MSDRASPRARLADKTITRRNRVLRGLWGVAYLLLYRPTLRPMHGWRCLVLRCFGARIAAGVRPYRLARIWAPWNLTMARDSTMGDFVDCYSVAPVHIGAGAIVSQYTYLCTASHDIDRAGLPLVAAPIVIGDGAWVAADCFIGPGVEIGARAVVGARSTVIDDIAAGDIVAGSPPRLLRQRGPAQ